MAYTDAAVADLLRQLFPPGAFDWMDAEANDGGLGDVLGQAGQEINEDAFERVDALALEIFPSFADERLAEWEAAFGLSTSRLAVHGTVAERRAQLVAYWRESGASTLANIKAALVAVTGSAAAVTMLEHSRAALKTANTHDLCPPATAIGAGVATYLAAIGDNAPCSTAGLQVLYTISHPTPADLTIELLRPGTGWVDVTSALTMDGVARGVHAADVAGDVIDGGWGVRVTNAGINVGTISFAAWVEGIGRDPATGAEGMGANIFEWSALIDETLVSSVYSRDLARAIVNRWNPAHCRGYLVIKASAGVGGGTPAIYDDINAIENGCVSA